MNAPSMARSLYAAPRFGHKILAREIKSWLFQISISAEACLIEVEQLPRFLNSDVIGANRSLDVLAQLIEQLLRVVLHVRQDLAHGVSLDDTVEHNLAALVERDVHRVGVAEEIVQVAEDFLIGAQEKRPEIIRLPVV